MTEKNPEQRKETRDFDTRELCHERLADVFDFHTSPYDRSRRVEVLIDDFLTEEMLQGKRTLDVGCGLGHFSERLVARGASVVACDIGPRLLALTKKRAGCETVLADALNLVDAFGKESFDLVVSSECIEHTPDPGLALEQMAAVLKPGGRIAVSTPNILWQPIVRTATIMKMRVFDGYENFSSWNSLERKLEDSGVEIERRSGMHLFPFQFGFHGFSKWIDQNCQGMRWAMYNLSVLGRKQG